MEPWLKQYLENQPVRPAELDYTVAEDPFEDREGTIRAVPVI